MNYKKLPVGAIAYTCGFNNISSFSRTFKKHFGITAKDMKGQERAAYTKNGVLYSKNGKAISKIGKKDIKIDPQFCSVELKNLIIMDTKIEIKEMPEMHVIYCRHMGAFNEIYKAYEKLAKWAGPRGLLELPEAKSLTLYRDDPSVTDIEKVRQDACIIVKEDVKVDGEIGKSTIKGGKYAVGHFEITATEFQLAWNTMCVWFTESGYQPADENTYELYHNNHMEHPEYKFIVDICIPIKPL